MRHRVLVRNGVIVLLDCAEICQTSANFMLRGSPLHTNTCAACAIVSSSLKTWT